MPSNPSDVQAYYSNAPAPPGQYATPEQQAQYQAAMDQFKQVHGPPPSPAPVVPPPCPSGGAGLPAARLGDMTAHGGVIVMGSPDVMIGFKPAARVTDMHTCPMVTGIVPHVGGPILPPAAATVLINFLPAARVTDQCLCVGPPDIIALGEFTVFIG
jgi:uncharacterized Zn-binding protein involved in type VI secretion